jgi:hypothetical protein
MVSTKSGAVGGHGLDNLITALKGQQFNENSHEKLSF